MLFKSTFLALALASSALASPAKRDCGDACCAAVTGTKALGDHGIRASHCASYLATTVTPPAITVTTSVTGTTPPSTHSPGWKRDVTYCPNKVPVYATSACGGAEGSAAAAAYSSACSCFGFTAESTTTVAPTTTTKTVYVLPTAATCSPETTTIYQLHGTSFTCAPSTATETWTVTTGGPTGPGAHYTVTVTADSTVTAAGPTGTGIAYTVTVTATSTPTAATCVVTSDLATKITNDFIQMLENTNQEGGTFPTALAVADLASNFTDTSDSINFMIDVQGGSVPLGGPTFLGLNAFIGGQGSQYPIPLVTTLNLFYTCNVITWRWVATGLGPNEVQGINIFIVGSDGKVIQNYSEFNSGAWLANYGNPQCQYATQCSAQGYCNSTSSSGKRSLDSHLLKKASLHY